MENASNLSTDETLHGAHPLADRAQQANSGLSSLLVFVPSGSRLKLVVYSFADQALAVGAMIVVNIALARTGTKEEYGMFALFYSVFTFLSAIHNATILEPFTVYGSGRYSDHFSEYLRLMTRANALLGLLLSATLLVTYLGLKWIAPQFASRALLGLALAVGVLLSGMALRRAFYVERQPALAVKATLVFFLTVDLELLVAVRAHVLSSFVAFLIPAVGWVVAGVCYARKLHFGHTQATLLELEPGYWGVHWKYARWVLITAFVFQLMTQGYYWLVACFLSMKEVGELRAMYNLIAPVEQVFIALAYLVLPAMAAHYAMKRIDNLLFLWKRYALAILGVTALFAGLLRIFGQQVMHVLYGGRFDGLGSLLFLLALLPILTATGNTMAQALNAAEKPKLVFYGFLCSGITTFVLGIPLVIHFGLRGAVYGMLLSGAAFSVVIGIGFLFAVYNKAQEQTTQIRLPPIAAQERP